MSTITYTRCPICDGFHQEGMACDARPKRMAAETPAVLWQEFSQPVRPPSLEADVFVPLAQAVVSFLLMWVLSTFVAYIALDWLMKYRSPRFAEAATIGFAAALGVLLWVWFRGISHSRQSQYQRDMREVPPPPIPEPVRAKPEPQRIGVKLEVVRKDGVDYMNLPLAPDKLRTMARALKAGRPFSVNSLTGAGAPLSRGEFMTMRDEFMERGYMVWKDEQNRTLGVEFTDAGMALLDELAALP